MQGSSEKPSACELCGSTSDYLNFHHLIPRALHGRSYFRNHYKKSYLKTHGVWICKFHCHVEIHKLVSEKDMGKAYYTKELLLEHPQVKSYIEWRRKRVK